VAGSADTTEETPGSFVLVGTGTEAYNIEFKGVFEFKVAVNSGNTPLALKMRELVRQERIDHLRSVEREAILKILGTSSTAQKINP
jgi:hypothetical protein